MYIKFAPRVKKMFSAEEERKDKPKIKKAQKGLKKQIYIELKELKSTSTYYYQQPTALYKSLFFNIFI